MTHNRDNYQSRTVCARTPWRLNDRQLPGPFSATSKGEACIDQLKLSQLSLSFPTQKPPPLDYP